MKIDGFDREIKGTLKQKTEIAVGMLDEIADERNFDIEGAHISADDILLCFAPVAVREAWKNITKYYA